MYDIETAKIGSQGVLTTPLPPQDSCCALQMAAGNERCIDFVAFPAEHVNNQTLRPYVFDMLFFTGYENPVLPLQN